MRYELAVSPINWRNDDMPELGKENSLEKFFTEAAAAGYDGVEMGAQFPKRADALSALLEPHGLKLASGWYDAGLLGRDAAAEFQVMQAHRDLLIGMHCNRVIVAETIGSSVHSDRKCPVSRRRKLSKDEWRMFLRRLDELARRTKDIGLELSYHAHMGTVVETAEDIAKMLEGTREVNLLFDTGHLFYAGADPKEIFRLYRERINHIHLKDVRPAEITHVKNEDSSFMDGVINGTFTVPSDGGLDFVSILNEIRLADYNGWLVVEAEQDPSKAPPAPLAKQAADFIRSSL